MALDLSAVLAAVNFSTTTVAVLSVAAALVAVAVVVSASFFVLGMVRGQVFYGGRFWDRDVYETALRDVKKQMRSGKLVDGQSRRAVNRFEHGDSRRSRSYRIPSTRF